MRTPSPLNIGNCTWPSAVKNVSSLCEITFTSITESMLTMTERFESVCGQIGVMVNTGAVGLTTGLVGAVGFGKSTLARMVAHDPRVRGAFGGGMIRGLGKELGIAEAAIDRLVHADFTKTKALTNRFDRPEVRVLAKMMVLRTVLGKKAAPPTPVNMDVLN